MGDAAVGGEAGGALGEAAGGAVGTAVGTNGSGAPKEATSWSSVADVLAARVLLPVYWAVIRWLPVLSRLAV